MNVYKRFQKKISDAKNIVITTHLYPDADGIGSQVALSMALKYLSKEVNCVNEGPLLERYQYLDPFRSIITPKQLKNKPIDLFIIVDAHQAGRIGRECQKLMESARDFLFIDHHPTSSAIKAIHCIDTKVAATGELVAKLIQYLKIPFTREMSICLYTSILIDTSSFRYPTVTGETHRVLGNLLDAGVSPPDAYNAIYGTKKISHIKFLGKVLSEIKISKDKHIAWLVIREEDLHHFQCDPEDTHAFINHLLILDDIQVACMFREVGREVKLSLRSHGKVDVGEMAQALGGGGHPHSAAVLFEGKIEPIIAQTIHNLSEMLSSGPEES